MSISRPDPHRKELVVNTPPQLSAEDVALLRARSTQPPTRSTPLANPSSPPGRSTHYSTMPPDGFQTPRRRQESTTAGDREEREESGVFSTSLPYSWTDSYMDESPSEMRQRWLTRQTFGPVLQSEGGFSTAVSTPYVYRNAEDVWGARGQLSSVLVTTSEPENGGLAKPLSFISHSSTVVAAAQPGKRHIVATRQPGAAPRDGTPPLSQPARAVSVAALPSPTRSSRRSEAAPSTTSMELPRSDSKRNLNKGLARGRAVHAIFEDEDDFYK